MKKLSLIALLFSIVILSWCWKNNPENKIDYSDYSWSLSAQEEIKFPNCVPEKLIDVQIFNMDDLVKNCTTKQKEWIFLDWLGWFTPTYSIYNNQIVTELSNDPSLVSGVVCRKTNANFINNYWLTDPLNITWYEITKTMIGRWLIDMIDGNSYSDIMYCTDDDTDCLDMKEFWWWIDWQNYFVAWYRSILMSPEDWHKLYVINDKIYYPWKTEIWGWIMKNSKWNFVWIKDNKIIVKRMKWWMLKWNPNFQDPALDPTTIKSTFTLETCEIDL